MMRVRFSEESIKITSVTDFRESINDALGDFSGNNMRNLDKSGKVFKFIRDFSMNIMPSEDPNSYHLLETLINSFREFYNSKLQEEKEEKGFNILKEVMDETLVLFDIADIKQFIEDERKKFKLKEELPRVAPDVSSPIATMRISSLSLFKMSGSVKIQEQIKDIYVRRKYYEEKSEDYPAPVQPKKELVRYLLNARLPSAILICEDDFRQINQEPTSSTQQQEIKNYEDFYSHTIQGIIQNSPSNRLQVIIGYGCHYTPLDIDKTEHSCFVFDAADDFRQYFIIDALSKIENFPKIYYVKNRQFQYKTYFDRNTKLQHDNFSCPLFSVDQSFHVSQINNIHTLLKNGDLSFSAEKLEEIDWLKTPFGNVVKNSQSTVFIDFYCSIHKDQEEYLMEAAGDNTKNFALGEIIPEYLSRVHYNDSMYKLQIQT